MPTLRSIVVLILASVVFGQAPPSFEVAAVKPALPDSQISGFQFPGAARLTVTAVSLKGMIGFAYDVRGFQVSGGPGWTGSERFDVVAKAGGSAAPVQMKAMLQTLLADRFKLTLRRESREAPMYNLVVAKSGSKLQESTQDRQRLGVSGRGQMEARKTSMAILAQQLSGMVGRTVIDKTGLVANYDFKLTWTPDETESLGPVPPQGGPAPLPADPNGPSLVTALQEQLGLRLETAKGPEEFLIVEHAEKPSDN